MEVTGKFHMDKTLVDERKSPRKYIVPEDEDILITDQHTRELRDGRSITEYTRTLGVVKNVSQVDDKLEFDWEPTDPGLINLVNAAKHPEKLFKYSPEHVAINKTDDYAQGEFGVLKSIAITNLPNDTDAITTRIKNAVKDFFTKDEGDDMVTKEEIREVVESVMGETKEKIDALEERIKAAEDVEDAVSKEDFQKVGEVLEKLKDLPDKIEKLEKNMSKLSNGDEEVREKLIKNIRSNVDLDEEVVKNMSMKDLEALNKKFEKKTPGFVGGNPTAHGVVEDINAKYGTDVGKSLEQ